ncbi:hypothetical protein IQ06DRAFT_313136 [Phaeosphaeriaceae sp. SRC1lsM3a]|nr:hypothetical protein IQ06DRAFT_313136 [Stagonospora sp. SRC1lsM3a]
MSEPRRSTRARAREEAAPAPETPKETPAKSSKSAAKRKRSSIVIKDPTPAADSPQGPKQQTLPLRISEGQPLPTLPEPQPLELPTSEWQDIQQSGVLGASLDRSRAVWISGVNFRVFHKFFNQPKKPADRTDEDKAKHSRQKDLLKNFPELGKDAVVSKDATKDNIDIQAQLVIEPHTFPIRIFAPREIIKQAPKKAPAPSSYGSWPNHHQPQHSQPNQYTQYNSQGQPIYQQKPPPPRPPPPKPVQKAPAPTPGPASTPAPDPVIHMLAQRAGVDPELKSVMKIVAAGQASKDQLEFFQSHINELTALLAKQKEEAAKASKSQSASATPKPVTQPPPTPKTPTGYRPLVFSFEEGNKDLLHFPSYSFLEWLPNMSGAKISFLITKMKPKLEQETVAVPPSTPAPKATPALTPGVTPSGTPIAATPNPTGFAQTPNQVPGQFQVSTPATPAAYVPQPRIEDFDEKKDIADIDFYQPVTVLLLTDNNEIRNSLVRAIRPPDVVEKYMDEVFDKCKRASETYLAFRLPRDAEAEPVEKRVKSGDGTPVTATPTVDRRFSGVGSSLGATLVSAADKKKAGRSRRSLV